jgi:hypothetical protein
LKLPSPEDVRINDPRICTRENRAVNWDLVDVFLRAIKDSGSLTLLGSALAISRTALVRRRKELRLRPLPTGRRPEVKLTEYELEVKKLLDQCGGVTHPKAATTVAAMMSVDRSTINSTAKRIHKKEILARELGCKECGGLGVVACNACENIGPHHHMCLVCGGNSTTWASQGL